MGSGAKLHMRKGFLIYEEMRKNFTIQYMRRPLVIQYMTLHPILLNCHTYTVYEENFLFFFISVSLRRNRSVKLIDWTTLFRHWKIKQLVCYPRSWIYVCFAFKYSWEVLYWILRSKVNIVFHIFQAANLQFQNLETDGVICDCVRCDYGVSLLCIYTKVYTSESLYTGNPLERDFSCMSVQYLLVSLDAGQVVCNSQFTLLKTVKIGRKIGFF
jgi:hypothetical protein